MRWPIKGVLLAALAPALLTGSMTAPAATTATAATPIFGVTVATTAHLKGTVAALAALPRRPTARIYFDVHQPASRYAEAARAIHRVGAVLGELLDSSDERLISVEALATRASEYVRSLGSNVDIWEVGNEVNGNWTGPYQSVEEKLSATYGQVHADGARTALTLYDNAFGPNNCGDGTSELTPLQFSERYVPAAVSEGLDYVLLSYYPTQCGGREPNAAEVGVQLEALHALYPHAQLGFGEIGLPRPAGRRTLASAQQIMRWSYSLGVALPYYVGGYFWWYGAQDALRPAGLLRETLAEAFTLEAAALGG